MRTQAEIDPSSATSKSATIYRMVMPDHVCPYGIKTLDLLEPLASNSSHPNTS